MLQKFTALPALTEGLTPWQRMFLDGVKENIELLTDQRGGGALAAVVKQQITTQYIGVGVGIDVASGAGTNVPTISEFNSLIATVNNIIRDLRS